MNTAGSEGKPKRTMFRRGLPGHAKQAAGRAEGNLELQKKARGQLYVDSKTRKSRETGREKVAKKQSGSVEEAVETIYCIRNVRRRAHMIHQETGPA